MCKILHLISTVIDRPSPSWSMEARLITLVLSLTNNPPTALQTQRLHLSRSHNKEEKGMACVEQGMTASLRNSASLKTLIQIFKSIRIVAKILASPQEY